MEYANSIDGICEDLIAQQRAYMDHGAFAKLVIDRLLKNPYIDLLLLTPYYAYSTVTNKIESLLGFQSPTFKVVFFTKF